MTEICTNHNHETVYSTKRKEWICPFCLGEPLASDSIRLGKKFDIDLYDYQREILDTEGHRCLVGARQVGKTTVAALEAALKARKGKVLSFINHNSPIVRRIVTNENIHNYEKNTPSDMKKFDYLVVGEASMVPEKVINPPIKPRQFKESLICGTPDNQYSPFHRIYQSNRFKVWQVPMEDCPGIPTEEVERYTEIMNQYKKKEVDAEFA